MRGAVGACDAYGTRAAVGVRECTTDSSDTLPEWLAHRPP
jgi:hypothetical protein